MSVVNQTLLCLALVSFAPHVLCAQDSDAAPAIAQAPARFLTAVDTQGQIHRLCAEPNTKCTALVFLTSECPISRQYIPELNRITAELSAEGAVVLGVLYDPNTTRSQAAQFAEEFKLAFPLLFDASGELAAHFQPTHVPEAFVLDVDGHQLYRGRIDDIYASVDRRRAQATTHDLRDALKQTLAGTPVVTARTQPIGCRLGTISDQPPAQVTYTRDIAPLLFAHCAECHRPGEVAPITLLSYEDAQKRADWLTEITGSGLMPPWKAEVGHVEFLGERRLSDFAKGLLKTWAATGAPQGDAADLPPAPTFSSDWRLGKPDLLLQAPVAFTIPADGPDVFQHFVIPSGLLEDKNVIGFEFRPGNPAVVHHAILFMDTMGLARAKDEETPEPGYVTFGSIGVPTAGIVGVWTPGMTPRFLPDGMGMILPKGADIVLQLHIHPSGKEETDQSSLALYFSDQPPTRQLSRAPLVLGSVIVDIPANDPQHEITSTVTLPTDVTLISVLPHMHLLGKEIKVTATLPDGQETEVVWIKDWNFYWQDNYVYKRPMTLPAGTRLDMYCSYDNTADNPANPTIPPKRVFFGNGSTDEMSFAIFQMVADSPGGQMSIQMGLRNTFMKQWAQAKLDAEARTHIVQEMMKLFGAPQGGDSSAFMRLLGAGGRGQSAD
ncbi:MAG: redoxin domain-containing protein [Pirellulaceae bacterium]|nr:redoxin domain-containing protein [Pirellulaceae bacterium]